MTILGTLFLVVLVFFGLHTAIALAPGKTLLAPYVVSFVGGVSILVLNANRIKFRLVSLYTVLAIILMIFAVVTAQGDGDLLQHILSTGQLLYSLVIAYGTFLGLQVLGIRRNSRLFLLAACVLIAGSFLEVYGGLRPVSDAFRGMVNSWRPGIVYNEDFRDTLYYGGVRPKFFASEPAILGSMTGFAILFWFLSARRFTGLRLLGAAVLTLPAFFLVRSPTILISGVVALVMFLSEIGRNKASRMRMAILCLGIVVVIVIAPGFVESNTNYGQSPSFFEREVGPPLVTAEVLRAQPILGTGIGGWAQMVPYGESVFNKANGQSYLQLQKTEMSDPDVAKGMMASAMWEYWVDLGLVGGVVVLWILMRAIGELKVPHRSLIFICSAFIFTMGGGMVNPRGWVGLFAIASLYQMHSAALTGEEEQVALEPQSAELVVGFPRRAD